ncbi:MAG: hypothetical protein AAFO89_13695 [Planctomycetota bacterium]
MNTLTIGPASLATAVLPAAFVAAQTASGPIVAFDSIDADGGLIGGMGCLGCESARRIFLDTTGGVLDAVELRLWNPDSVQLFSDAVRATVYDAGIQAPGDPLASATIQLTLNPDENGVVRFNLPNTPFDTNQVWLGLYTPSEDSLIWTFSFESSPAVGDMQGFGRTRDDGEGPWVGSFSVPSAQQARVLLVPAPASGMAVAVGAIAVYRRRR